MIIKTATATPMIIASIIHETKDFKHILLVIHACACAVCPSIILCLYFIAKKLKFQETQHLL